MSEALTVEEAERLAAAIFAEMQTDWAVVMLREEWRSADRERVESDLAGLREHLGGWHVVADGWSCLTCRRYSDGLRRTAVLYGVT